jgi:hypothetical protein
MSVMKATKWREKLALLAVSALLTACSGVASTASKTSPPSTPRLTLTPSQGPLNTELSIEGSGFPVAAPVRITMGEVEATRPAQFIGQVAANERGAIKLAFILPSLWSDGTPITERQLRFTALVSQSDAVYADYTNTSAPAQTRIAASGEGDPRAKITLSPATGTVNTRVIVNGVGFSPNNRVSARIGVVGAGAGPQEYANAVSSGEGTVSMILMIPSVWPDGRKLSEPQIVIMLSSDDGRSRAVAEFSLSPATALTATSLAPVAPNTTASSPVVTRTTNPLSSDAPTPASPEPIQTSIDFLYSLLRDPSGASSVAYLSQRLRTEISNNWALPTGLGIQPGYTSFEVVMLNKADDKVVMQATLTYESGASVRDLTLTKEGNNWRIDQVVAGSH